jgi:major vault protein
MTERDVRERDILVASNEFAYVQDLTKGDIVLYVGPTKISLSNTERLVDFRHGRFLPVRAGDGGLGVSPFVAASSSQYIVLENPTRDPTARPVKGNNSAAELLTGRKVVVPGPASFPLWPGQRAKVVDGHELGEDEYLVVRVYDNADGDERPIGTQAIVRGEDVRFYIPRTGIEVLATENGYVRRSWRLRKGMGLHVRVIKPFTAGPGEQVPPGAYEAGQEIFLKDREGFFFPTENL